VIRCVIKPIHRCQRAVPLFCDSVEFKQRSLVMLAVAVPADQGAVAMRVISMATVDGSVTVCDGARATRDCTVALAQPRCQIASGSNAVAFGPQHDELNTESSRRSTWYNQLRTPSDRRFARCDQLSAK
jgi:hypothetical protein